jgi:hypothetical protein
MKYALYLMLAIGVLSPKVSAQTSVGFSAPDDIGLLLDYRLPDWGYRVWDLGFDFRGGGRQDVNDTGYFDFAIGSSLDMYGESEQKVWQLNSRMRGAFNRQDYDYDDDTRNGYRWLLYGEFVSGGSLRRYISTTISYAVRAAGQVRYRESVIRQGTDRHSTIDRLFDGELAAGVGLGRVRNITPLLRAQRLSERLRTLGRRPLSDHEIRRLAEVLARESGYRTVFDRGNKDFWRDVFNTFNPDEPLTPYEILYLSEVLAEDIGGRLEGSQVSLSGVVSRRTNDSDETNLGPELRLDWSHNFDLAHQLSLMMSGQYLWEVDRPGRLDAGRADLHITYLWALADRVLWTNSVLQQFLYYQHNDVTRRERNYGVEFESAYSIFIEDRLRLRPCATIRYRTMDTTGYDTHEDWNWEVGVSLAYALDKVLY